MNWCNKIYATLKLSELLKTYNNNYSSYILIKFRHILVAFGSITTVATSIFYKFVKRKLNHFQKPHKYKLMWGYYDHKFVVQTSIKLIQNVYESA